MSELTKSLKRLEAKIEQGLETFVEVGNALRAIRNHKMYLEEFDSFEAYIEGRWSRKRRWAYQLIEAAEIEETLPEDVRHGAQKPTSERQYRELAKVPEENRAQVLEAANETAAEQSKPLTASIIKKTAADFFEPKEVEEYEDVDDSELLEPVIEKPKLKQGQAQPDAKLLIDTAEKTHISPVIRLLDKIAEAMGGRGEQYHRADEAIEEILQSFKQMRLGKQ